MRSGAPGPGRRGFVSAAAGCRGSAGRAGRGRPRRAGDRSRAARGGGPPVVAGTRGVRAGRRPCCSRTAHAARTVRRIRRVGTIRGGRMWRWHWPGRGRGASPSTVPSTAGGCAEGRPTTRERCGLPSRTRWSPRTVRARSWWSRPVSRTRQLGGENGRAAPALPRRRRHSHRPRRRLDARGCRLAVPSRPVTGFRSVPLTRSALACPEAGGARSLRPRQPVGMPGVFGGPGFRARKVAIALFVPSPGGCTSRAVISRPAASSSSAVRSGGVR